MSEIKISIVVPVYNIKAYLKECLASVLVQSLVDWEAIIVDDCSSDGSIDVAQAFVEKDPRFKLFSHEKNQGLGESRNTGCRAARGEYLLFLDGDDVLCQDILNDMYTKAKDSDADLLIGDFFEFAHEKGVPDTRQIYPAGAMFQQKFADKHKLITWQDMAQDFDLIMFNIFSTTCCGKLFKLSLWRELGCEAPLSLRMAEDFIPVKKFIFSAKSILPYPHCVILYRKRAKSATQKRTKHAFEILRAYPEAVRVFQKVLPKGELAEYIERFFIRSFHQHMCFFLPYRYWWCFYQQAGTHIKGMTHRKHKKFLRYVALDGWAEGKALTFINLCLLSFCLLCRNFWKKKIKLQKLLN